MNKSQFVEALSVHFEGNRRQASHALEAFLDTVQRELTKKGGKVALTGFGAFEAVERGARTVRNPRTGETKRAKKTTVPKFRAGAELKAVVKGEKKLPKVAVSSTGTAAKTTATKTAAKKTTAKRAPAKKAPAKKAAAKKTTARKAPAKKTAKKTARKR